MPPAHPVQRLLHNVSTKIAVNAEYARVAVEMSEWVRLLQQPVLQLTEGKGSLVLRGWRLRCRNRRPRRAQLFDNIGQVGDGRIFEERDKRHVNAKQSL